MNTELELSIATETSILDVPRMVLFDDDPFFVRMMEQCARKNFIPLTGIWRMEDIPHIVQQDFDLAIIDFDLGDLNGIDLVEFLNEVFLQLPTIMISNTKRSPNRSHPWPQSIQSFVMKEDGARKILDTAIKVHAAAAGHQWPIMRDSYPIF